MIALETQELPEGLSDIYRHWVYNGLDCCVTYEVKKKQEYECSTRDTVHSDHIFNFEMSMRLPALEMMLNGIKIDPVEHMNLQNKFESRLKLFESHFDRLCETLFDRTFNPRSPVQLQDLLYNHLGLKPVLTLDKKTGQRKPTTNREALEKLSTQHPAAKGLIQAILAIRDCGKLVGSLHAGVDPDGRMRFSFNPSATETGRWSSSKNVYGRGLNAQNQTEEIRSMFIADEGYKLCYADLEQAESRAVAYISGDENYIKACESEDLHTTVCRLIWPDLSWTGNLVDDKALAEEPFYRHFSYRDIAKRAGHATNYYGTAYTLAKILRIEQGVIEKFQRSYFDAFPGIRRWHIQVRIQLEKTARLVTPCGRERQFFGRVFDDSTLREAIAFLPQSTVADLLNFGLFQVQQYVPEVMLLKQVHDAGLWQYPEDRPEVNAQAIECLQVPLDFPHGTMRIPVEAKCGYRWQKKHMALFNSDFEKAQVRPKIDYNNLVL